MSISSRPPGAMQYVITTSHTSKYPDPIRFSVGDRLTLGRTDDRYPGWIRVTVPTGNEGWAPESLIRFESDEQGVALSEYTARELNTVVGEHVSCAYERDGWLWVENDRGRSGWIPKETVRATSP